MKHPIHRKVINGLNSKFNLPIDIAKRVYTLMRFLYGSNWDRSLVNSKEGIRDFPRPLYLDVKFTGPEQELRFLIRKFNLDFVALQRLI